MQFTVDNNISANFDDYNYSRQERYVQLVLSLKEQLTHASNIISSAIIYGSFSRLEIFSDNSDIDMLCVLKGTHLTKSAAVFLNQVIKNLHNQYKVKFHLRIRNCNDLIKKSSGLIDCGFTSAINKLRDGILIAGTSIDDMYLDYISRSAIEEIYENIVYRFSDLKYQSRALLSMCSNYSDEQEYNAIFRYKCGCLLFQLSELACYSQGIHITSAIDSIIKAKTIFGNDVFDEAVLLKQGDLEIELPDFVVLLDELISMSANRIRIDELGNLKKITLKRNETPENISSKIDQWKVWLAKFGVSKGSIVMKESYVDDNGMLNICSTKI